MVSSIFSNTDKHEDISSMPYKIIFSVHTRDVDYTDLSTVLTSILDHPQFLLAPGDAGHAWVMLVSDVAGEKEVINCGYFGESGKRYAGFLESVLLHWVNPKTLNHKQQFFRKRFQNNPIALLFEDTDGGWMEFDNYTFIPSYAAAMKLTKEQYNQLRTHIREFDKSIYSVTKYQCVDFVNEIALQLGLKFDNRVTIDIPKYLQIKNRIYKLWSDPKYSNLTSQSPDRFKRNLTELVNNGTLVDANSWVRENYQYQSKNDGRLGVFNRILKPFNDYRIAQKKTAYKKIADEILQANR